ncbi:MAG: hypothetical protein IK081_03275 [Lachnospiraceae bacterium]|nr:hypothetical protein [Lachnospiraceae bacterium]
MKKRRIIMIGVAGTCLIIFGILCLLGSGIFQDRQEKNVLVDFGSGGTSFCGPSYYWDWEVINLDLEPENIPDNMSEGEPDNSLENIPENSPEDALEDIPGNVMEDVPEDALAGEFTLEVNDYSFAYAVKNENGETKSPQTSILSFTVTSKEQMPPEAESIALFRKDGENYVDVTPKDVTIEQNTEEIRESEEEVYYYLFGLIKSTNSVSLSQGEYYLKLDGYNAHFRLEWQQKVAY